MTILDDCDKFYISQMRFKEITLTVGRFLIKNKTGMTMVELMMAVAIILVVVVPLTRVLFKSLQGAISFGDANKAVQLAQDLMEEIKQKRWDENEPVGGGATPLPYSAIGRDGAEVNPDTDGSNGAKIGGGVPANAWDDIDDYNGLNEFPPRDVANNVIASACFPTVPLTPKFTRTVAVRYVNVPDGGQITAAGGTTDYKEIRVTVDWRGRIAGSAVVVTTIRANIRRF